MAGGGPPQAGSGAPSGIRKSDWFGRLVRLLKSRERFFQTLENGWQYQSNPTQSTRAGTW